VSQENVQVLREGLAAIKAARSADPRRAPDFVAIVPRLSAEPDTYRGHGIRRYLDLPGGDGRHQLEGVLWDAASSGERAADGEGKRTAIPVEQRAALVDRARR
jgi:hypothetical protein